MIANNSINATSCVKLFDDSRCPIFVVSNDHRIKDSPNDFWGQKQGIIYNPPLKHYNFAKVKDPFTTFQDIRMWLSNLAYPEPKMKEMTNEENAARLGHGDKYSFRTPPSKHVK